MSNRSAFHGDGHVLTVAAQANVASSMRWPDVLHPLGTRKMDKGTRNAIQRATQAARALIEEEFRQQLEGTYDILLTGEIAEQHGLHLSAEQAVVRDKLVAAIAHRRAGGTKPAAAVASYLRDAAFTSLNRFVALKMLEARGLVQECVSTGDESSGFKEFAALSPGLLALPDKGYRLYIESLFDEVATEVRVLFDRRDPASLLWPRRQALHDLLELLEATELAAVWDQDETVGWVYQYFNSDADREAARYDAKGKPKAPGSAYELAIRNQFFTPRYVVEFLTDNTLGRLWCEMMGGETKLAELPFLARRRSGSDTPSRRKKDPRDLRILDPACGSGHFLLYAFELLLVIYEEAFADANAASSSSTGRTLEQDYGDVAALRAALPALILHHNLHGIDIDPRAAQIASLSLWLRSQRAFSELRVDAADRSRVKRTHIVVGEPMPGDRQQVEAFAERLTPPFLGELFRHMVAEMKLAGEMGPLLRIERTLSDSVAEARRQFVAELGRPQPTLPGFDLEPRQGELDLTGITDTAFFERAEEAIVRVLDELARSHDGAERVRQRLFAEDARSGVAFIELLREPFDVVVMNPPFGETSVRTKSVIDSEYPNSRQDLFAVFVERCIELVPMGFVGVLSTAAGFFRRTLEPWRRNVLLAQSTLRVLGHLGDNVLDGAKVRVAAYVVEMPPGTGSADYIRAMSTSDRASREPHLRAGVGALQKGAAHPSVFSTDQTEFEKLPYAVFGYWCSRQLRSAFVKLPMLEGNVAHARVGGQTSDDSRFLRLRWEVTALESAGFEWRAFAKGGEYSPYHDDIHLVIPWREDRGTLWGFTGRKGRKSETPSSADFFFRAGLTYPRRTTKRFAPRALPAGCAFGDKGPAIVDVKGSNWGLLAMLNSRPISYLFSLGTGAVETMDASNSYEVGLLQRLPVPTDAVTDNNLEALGRAAWLARADLDLRDEATALFNAPFAPLGFRQTIDETCRRLVRHLREQADTYVAAQEQIDTRVVELYGFEESDWQDIQAHGGEIHVPDVPDDEDDALRTEMSARLVHYLVGASFGRWDVTALRTSADSLEDTDPFAAIDMPSMLLREDAQTALVDDVGHPADIVEAVKGQLRIAGIEEPDIVLAEGADYLGVTRGGIRGWLSKSAFGDHIKRYTKSRRKAPIYWQLATPSGSYSVWLYYHRFTSDTLYRVVRDFVVPKLAHAETALAKLRADSGKETGSKARKEIEAQQVLVEELRVLHEEIARVAPLWSPRLDDGVIVTFAPLWRLLAHERSWQTQCLATWDALCDGDYDWAHLAMHLWPERVVPKCATDRSLAISHGLEDVFWRKQEDGKWHRRAVDHEGVAALIEERTSRSVKDALQSLLDAPTPATKGKRARRKSKR